MDYIESVTFVTRDAKWVEKIALGALATLLSVVVVGALALLGWAMEAFRRVIRRADEKLPDWADWSTYLADGLKLAGVKMNCRSSARCGVSSSISRSTGTVARRSSSPSTFTET